MFRCLPVLRLILIALMFLPAAAGATNVTLRSQGGEADLADRLRAASASVARQANSADGVQDILAAALSDYTTLVQVLYDQGYFSPVVNIRLDGREAAQISLVNPPAQVERVEISVKPGPLFQFGRARISPLATGTQVPEGFASGQPASTGLIQETVAAGRDGWRDLGHAKARLGSQEITADHRKARLNAELTLIPGPQLRFGQLLIDTDSAVRPEAVKRIAALPTGQRFSPQEAQKAATRLRRTGAFASVSLREADAPNADGTLDFNIGLRDQLPRRITFGAELNSRTGLDLSAIWIHRNLFGAAERLRIEGRLSNLGGDQDIDGLFSVRLDQPARLGGDNNLFYLGEYQRLQQPHFDLDHLSIGVGIRRVSSKYRWAEGALVLSRSTAEDAFGKRRFTLLSLPLKAQFDRRDDQASATRGQFAEIGLTPFVGLGKSASGATASLDFRTYHSLTASGSVVLAGRLQLGSAMGADLQEISPDLLFFSGGAGTVRGHPYQSLGVPVGTKTAGGRSFLSASAELRAKVYGPISLVGFYDFGAVGDGAWIDSGARNHEGAGLGLRYNIDGFGPVRLDLALPVSGSTGDGLQFYIGIGQAF